MKLLNKIGHWILFITFGYISTWIVLAIATLLPFFVGFLLFGFSDFWFFFLGSIALGVYYLIIYGGLGLFFNYLNQKKPDYWVSNMFIVFVTLFFFYTLINILGKNITESKAIYTSFKGVLFLITILPAYLQILFFAIVNPFIVND